MTDPILQLEARLDAWTAEGALIAHDLAVLKKQATPEPLPLWEIASEAFNKSPGFSQKSMWQPVVDAVIDAAVARGLVRRPLVVDDELVERMKERFTFGSGCGVEMPDDFFSDGIKDVLEAVAKL